MLNTAEIVKINVLEQAFGIEEDIIPECWTAEHLGKRFVEAFKVLRRMPPLQRPKEFGNGLPQIVRDADDYRNWTEQDKFEHFARLAAAPTRIEITHMEICLEWIRWLRAFDSGLAVIVGFWALRRAEERSIRHLCIEKKWSFRNFYRKRDHALSTLATHLNRTEFRVF